MCHSRQFKVSHMRRLLPHVTPYQTRILRGTWCAPSTLSSTAILFQTAFAIGARFRYFAPVPALSNDRPTEEFVLYILNSLPKVKPVYQEPGSRVPLADSITHAIGCWKMFFFCETWWWHAAKTQLGEVRGCTCAIMSTPNWPHRKKTGRTWAAFAICLRQFCHKPRF